MTVTVASSRLAEAQNWRCAYCGGAMTTDPSTPSSVTRDHATPKCEGGPSDWANLVAACHACNAVKGGTPCAERFARHRRRFANNGRWPPGQWPDATTRDIFLARLQAEEYDELLDQWRRRRGLSRPGKSERAHLRAGCEA